MVSPQWLSSAQISSAEGGLKLIKKGGSIFLRTAVEEHREPSLHYPAIDIAEVQRRIAANVQLKEEIHHQEPNVIVRRLYEGAIEEELDYLHLIEATYEHNSQKFHEYSLRVFPLPTPEEMKYALTHIERTLAQGLKCADTANLSQQLLAFLQTDLGLILDLTSDEDVCPQGPQKSASIQPQETPKISAQAAKRFFEAVFRESGYEGWQVLIDLNATNAAGRTRSALPLLIRRNPLTPLCERSLHTRSCRACSSLCRRRTIFPWSARYPDAKPCLYRGRIYPLSSTPISNPP